MVVKALHMTFLSPPNEVSEGTMKRAPYVCVSMCLSVWAQKSMKNATSLAFLGQFWFCLFYLIGLGAGFKTSTARIFWNSLIMQIYANLFKINQKCYFSVISWPILILFILSDRALVRAIKDCLHRILKFMQIYSKSMKNATSLSFLGRFWFCLFYLIGLGAGFKTSTQNFEINYANLCKFIQNQQKMLLLYFLGDFDSVWFIW